MAKNDLYISPFEGKTPEERFVAYIDILGFGKEVNDNLEAAIDVYEDLIGHCHLLGRLVNLSIYSDSIILQSAKLIDVAYVATMVQFIALTRNYLVRGGIAVGKHLESRQNGNLFVVSKALVKAVKQEKLNQTQETPCITLHHEINPVPSVVLNDPARIVVEYKGQNIVNPFNPHMESSQRDGIHSQLIELRDRCPEKDQPKYTWYIELMDFILRTYGESGRQRPN